MDDHGPLARYWDLIQLSYDYAAETDIIVALLADGEVRRVLDVGCGTGSHLIELARRGLQGVGVDRSAEMVRVARDKARRLALPLAFCQAELSDLPFAPEFDAIVSVYVMSTFLTPAEFGTALSALRRALRRGRLLIFNVLNAEHEGSEAISGPVSYMDLGFRHGDIGLARFNHMITRGDVQDCTYTYLIQDGDRFSMEILHNPMRFFTLDWVRQQLAACGFRYQSVQYVNVGGVRGWDMFISAVAI